MANEYEAPDPAIADRVHRDNRECEEDALRLENAPTADLKEVVRDRSATQSARMNALLFLRIRKDPEFNDIALELFDDPDQHLWRETRPSKSMLQDERFRRKYFEMLDGQDLENMGAAAVGMAMAGEASLIPRFADWLNNGDEPHRNVAMESLRLLNTPESCAVLTRYWDEGKGDEEARLCLAGALIQADDPRGRPLLDAVAMRAQGLWSVTAATLVYVAGRYRQDPNDQNCRDGLRLMLHILKNGDHEAMQGMVNQIWNFEHLPHAFTADGRDEARAWIESQLENASS